MSATSDRRREFSASDPLRAIRYVVELLPRPGYNLSFTTRVLALGRYDLPFVSFRVQRACVITHGIFDPWIGITCSVLIPRAFVIRSGVSGLSGLNHLWTHYT